MRNEFTKSDCEQYAKHFIQKYLKKDWKFVWSVKMTSAFGYCCSNFTIKLSSRYFELNKKFPTIIQNIILHEIAHAMQLEEMGYLSHDKHWKNYCLQIGALPKRQFSTYEVTTPCEKFALRDSLNGKVIEYFQFFNRSRIADVFKDFQFRLEEEEARTNTKINHELVWCGK